MFSHMQKSNRAGVKSLGVRLRKLKKWKGKKVREERQIGQEEDHVRCAHACLSFFFSTNTTYWVLFSSYLFSFFPFPPPPLQILGQTDRYEAIIFFQLQNSSYEGVKSYGLAPIN